MHIGSCPAAPIAALCSSDGLSDSRSALDLFATVSRARLTSVESILAAPVIVHLHEVPEARHQALVWRKWTCSVFPPEIRHCRLYISTSDAQWASWVIYRLQGVLRYVSTD